MELAIGVHAVSGGVVRHSRSLGRATGTTSARHVRRHIKYVARDVARSQCRTLPRGLPRPALRLPKGVHLRPLLPLICHIRLNIHGSRLCLSIDLWQFRNLLLIINLNGCLLLESAILQILVQDVQLILQLALSSQEFAFLLFKVISIQIGHVPTQGLIELDGVPPLPAVYYEGAAPALGLGQAASSPSKVARSLLYERRLHLMIHGCLIHRSNGW